jgi:hypothetical protein
MDYLRQELPRLLSEAPLEELSSALILILAVSQKQQPKKEGPLGRLIKEESSERTS